MAELYPAFKELIDGLVKENSELKAVVTAIGERIAATEQKYASAMELQGRTFRDIITLSALPVAKKEEILAEYRRIDEAGENERKAW